MFLPIIILFLFMCYPFLALSLLYKSHLTARLHISSPYRLLAVLNPQKSNSFRMSSSAVENAAVVKQRIEGAARRVDRNPDSVRLVAVSKTKPVEVIQQLYQAGYRHFGENYFQELADKSEKLPKDINWHFIGHLQSSKASKIIRDVPNLFLLETVDSEKLASKLHAACENACREELNIFIQVDTSGEDTKSGVSEEELLPLITFILSRCPRLKICGLMTIGRPNDLSCFEKLVNARRLVAAHLSVPEEGLELSMGMSGDFEEAITHGATSVRVGSTIFGERLYTK